jgi:two-component system, OmpR family, response regulator
VAKAARILVVDDDPDIRRMAALALERWGGFRVTLAADGEEALELAAQDPPDLVLLDVSMPGLDGPATLKALRARPATQNVPVVFFTATSSEVEADRLRALGAVAVVSKPFEVADLARCIRRVASPGTLD